MKHQDDDLMLFRQIQDGDEKAFETLFNHYFTPLCRFVHLYIENKQEAKEIVMSLFVSIWENREKIVIRISAKAYLFQSVRNRIINHLKRSHKTVSIDQLSTDPQEMPENYLENEELSRLIYEAIMHLPSKCRDIFLLSRRDELSHKEISQQLSISTKTVEVQITNAIRQIRAYLKEQY